MNNVSERMREDWNQRALEDPHYYVAFGSRDQDEEGFLDTYAVSQHIPSRDVVLEYMRETRRVLKPGGIFRGQFNGLPHSAIPDTWSGVAFSADDIRTFTIEHGFQLLNLEGVDTQYMWTT